MLDGILRTHQISTLIFAFLVLLIAWLNGVMTRRLEKYPRAKTFPFVSILIPARNEARNLEACLNGLLNQDYPAYEVLVLDDHSSDATPQILAQFSARDSRLRVLQGLDIPDGWLGKHWACHQLAQVAQGEWLLFADADTVFHPQTVSDAVAAVEEEQADFLTAVPHEQMVTLGERLLVPYFLISALSFIPVFLSRWIKLPVFTFTIGQFIFIRAQAYRLIGGHQAVRDNAVDDLALGKRAVAMGLRWCIADGRNRITCRMYHSFREAWQGFSKNMFAAFGYNVAVYLFIWLWSAVLFLEPLVVLIGASLGWSSPYFRVDLALLHWMVVLFIWGLAYYRLRMPVGWALLYPVVFLLALIVAGNSFWLTLRGQAEWKGRKVLRPKIRWI